MYLKISNKGEMDPQSLTLLGASSKRGEEGKIGMFGSGNKYAIAYLLRSQIGLTIYSGESQIVVHTETENFREKSFDVIYINNQKTSITTDSGPQWELWKAIREIYSNAIDEGLLTMEVVSEVAPAKNETHFYIEYCEAVVELHQDFSKYFAIEKNELFVGGNGKIYKKDYEEGVIFRKGIRCGKESGMLFEYDMDVIDITEDRVLKSTSQCFKEIIQLIYKCTNTNVVSRILRGDAKECFETSLFSRIYTWNMPSLETMSDTWRECLYGKKICFNQASMLMTTEDYASCIALPMEFFDVMRGRFGDEIVHPALIQNGKVSMKYKRANLDGLQSQLLKEVLDFFKECQYEIPYPIDIVKFASAKTHGMAENGKILLSIDAFTRGKDWIANVIVEELIHLKYEVVDETRSFQDSAIMEMIGYMKMKNAHSL